MSDVRLELEQVYDRHQHQFFACALSMVGNKELAEDVVHDVFCRSLRLTELPQNLKAYLFRGIRNAAVDVLRRQSRVKEVCCDDLFTGLAQPTEPDEDESYQFRLAQALTWLNDDQREVIMQHLVGGLTFREIAELQDVALGTLTARYHRGIKKLKQYMGKSDE